MKKNLLLCLPLLGSLVLSPLTSYASEQISTENISSNIEESDIKKFEDFIPKRNDSPEIASPPQISNTNYLLISTWQDLVHAINSPAINRMELQNNITIPHEVGLSAVERYISIEGNGYNLDLGGNTLILSDDFSLSEIKLQGQADTLIYVESSSRINSYITNTEINLTEGQTFLEGDSTRVFLNGTNLFSSAPSQNTPVAFKVNYLTIIGEVDASEIALYDGSNGTTLPTSVDNFGKLNGYISTSSNKPFINNAELVDVHINSVFSVKSASDSPLISYTRSNGAFETPFIYLDEQSSTSLENKGPLFTGRTYYQVYSVGYNTIQFSSLSNVVNAPRGVSLVLEGTENIVLENLSAGGLFNSDFIRASIGGGFSVEPIIYNIGMKPIGHANIPFTIFNNIENLSVTQTPNLLLASSNNSELRDFIRNIGGIRNISTLKLNDKID